MENASKALIMAASVLLGVMLITFGTFLFIMFSNFSKEHNSEVLTRDVSQFNSQFTKYESNDNTAQDIVTVINLVKDCNQAGENITVSVTYNYTVSQKSTLGQINYFLHQSTDKDRYKGQVTTDSKTGKITKITFTKL